MATESISDLQFCTLHKFDQSILSQFQTWKLNLVVGCALYAQVWSIHLPQSLVEIPDKVSTVIQAQLQCPSLFLFSNLWGRLVDYRLQEDLPKFGYMSERTVEKFRSHAILWQHATTCCLNVANSKKRGDAKYPLTSSVGCMFLLSSCTCFSTLLGSA